MSDNASTWTSWQREHAEALASLQERQREYHRLVTQTAFGVVADDQSRTERNAALLALESASHTLDAIRARRPPEETR